MRFDKGHKEQTRRRIVETAARRFRKEGVEAVGIAGLMADAGLTHGGFYAHFASKEDLVRAALEEASMPGPGTPRRGAGAGRPRIAAAGRVDPLLSAPEPSRRA